MGMLTPKCASGRRYYRRQWLGESMVSRVELHNVCSYLSLIPSILTYHSSYPETETMTTYTTVTTCPLTTSSGSAYYTTLTTSTVVVTSCKGGCHNIATPPPPPPPKKTFSIGTTPLTPPSSSKSIAPSPPPPSVTSLPPKPSKGTTLVISSVPQTSETPIYSNVCKFLGKWNRKRAKDRSDYHIHNQERDDSCDIQYRDHQLHHKHRFYHHHDVPG